MTCPRTRFDQPIEEQELMWIQSITSVTLLYRVVTQLHTLLPNIGAEEADNAENNLQCTRRKNITIQTFNLLMLSDETLYSNNAESSYQIQ